METEKTVDLHGMQVREAKRYIERYLMALPSSVMQVRVIHGGNGQNPLALMVRKIKSPRLSRRILTMNPGETLLLLKNQKEGK